MYITFKKKTDLSLFDKITYLGGGGGGGESSNVNLNRVNKTLRQYYQR